MVSGGRARRNTIAVNEKALSSSSKIQRSGVDLFGEVSPKKGKTPVKGVKGPGMEIEEPKSHSQTNRIDFGDQEYNGSQEIENTLKNSKFQAARDSMRRPYKSRPSNLKSEFPINRVENVIQKYQNFQDENYNFYQDIFPKLVNQYKDCIKALVAHSKKQVILVDKQKMIMMMNQDMLNTVRDFFSELEKMKGMEKDKQVERIKESDTFKDMIDYGFISDPFFFVRKKRGSEKQ